MDASLNYTDFQSFAHHKNVTESDYTLNFDTLEVNMLNTDNITDNMSNNQAESVFQKGLPPGASNISHCKNLMQYIVHVKKNNKKYIALLDTGSGVSCIKADIASQFIQYKAPTQLRAKLAASTDNN
eukprot:577963-Prorocentrum_minimum.AAC.1